MSLSNPMSSWDVRLPARYDLLDWRQRGHVRQMYGRLQKHMCWFCGSSLYQDTPEELRELPIDWSLFPPEFTKYPMHLHHNHETGMTIGTVHSFCNAFMWHYFGE